MIILIMNYMKPNLLLMCSFLIWGCSHNLAEKHQNKRDQVIDVHGRVKEIKTGNIFLNSYSDVYKLNKYIIVCEYNSYENQIYLFDRDNFNFVVSTAPVGQGPGEIANIGFIAIDEINHVFYVNDNGKQKIFSYPIDSILTNPNYIPETKMSMNEREFPRAYQYINDTFSIGTIIKPTGNYGFNQYSARWNMRTGEIQAMPDLHPEIQKKRYDIAVSVKHGICVESYQRHDLLTIRTLSGDLKYNIYGPEWEISTKKKILYFGDVTFCKDKILVLYSGTDAFTKNQHGDPVSVLPEKFMLFDLNGDYLKTFDVGYQISSFCYDESNNRLILSMDDEIQFGYLDLDGLID